jgi:hypothetical protein
MRSRSACSCWTEWVSRRCKFRPILRYQTCPLSWKSVLFVSCDRGKCTRALKFVPRLVGWLVPWGEAADIDPVEVWRISRLVMLLWFVFLKIEIVFKLIIIRVPLQNSLISIYATESSGLAISYCTTTATKPGWKDARECEHSHWLKEQRAVTASWPWHENVYKVKCIY